MSYNRKDFCVWYERSLKLWQPRDDDRVGGVHVRHRLVQGKEYCQGDHNRAWELTDWSRIGVLLLCCCYCYCVPHVRCSRRRIYKRERKDNNFRMPHTAAIEEEMVTTQNKLIMPQLASLYMRNNSHGKAVHVGVKCGMWWG
jgi:hypothetical protein